MADSNRALGAPLWNVVVVNGDTDALDILDAAFDAGRYDVTFLSWSDRPYTRIKQALPQLVILCASLECPEGFQLLTMLNLDPETRDIPVFASAMEHGAPDSDPALSQPTDAGELRLPHHPAPRMN